MTQPFLGEIRMFGGNFAPRGWALCNGQLLSISSNSALFSLIGTTYGGDGRTTFALPNLQSQVAVGQGNGIGLTPRDIGQTGGAEIVTLTQQEIPAHSHGLVASTTVAGPGGEAPASSLVLGTTSVTTGHFYTVNDGSQPPPGAGQLNANSCSQVGGNQTHTNLMPTLCVSLIIALQGLFPSRN